MQSNRGISQRTRGLRMSGALLCAAAAMCTLSAGAPDALAQKPPAGEPSPQDVKKATSHFEKGAKLYEQKKHALALQEFKASYATVPSPNSHLYIARCMAALGETREAYVEFDKTVEEADARAKTEAKYAPTRDTAKTERDELLSKLALVTVDVKGADPGARLKVGSVEVPASDWGKPIPVMPGQTEVVLERTSGEPVKESLSLGAGDKKQVALDASAVATPAPTAPPPEEPQVKADTSSGGNAKLRPWAYVAGGVGVAGLAVFTIAGIMANSTYSDLEDKCAGPCEDAEDVDQIDSGRTQQTLANVGLVVGIVGIGAGVTLFVLSLGGKSSEAKTGQARLAPVQKPQLVVGPSFTGVRGKF